LETDIQITTKLVAKDLLLEADDRIFHSLEQLQSWLSEQIAHMMELEFERLLSTLYRIDVDEQRAKLAIAGDHPSWELAGLIIERELKKGGDAEALPQFRVGGKEYPVRCLLAFFDSRSPVCFKFI
jgi:hypothetical protein